MVRCWLEYGSSTDERLGLRAFFVDGGAIFKNKNNFGSAQKVYVGEVYINEKGDVVKVRELKIR